jgi:hypothetical protein
VKVTGHPKAVSGSVYSEVPTGKVVLEIVKPNPFIDKANECTEGGAHQRLILR